MILCKKALLKRIDILVEDAQYWQERYKDEPDRISFFKGEVEALLKLRAWYSMSIKPIAYKRGGRVDL